MKRAAVVAALIGCGMTLAAEGQPCRFAFQPFTGHYSIYGGGLGDPVAPSEQSMNFAFSINGPVAKQISRH
jgi:hypothetical protein